MVDRTSEVLTILTPAHAAGVADVHVDNGNGTGATWTAGFTFEPDQFVRYFAEGASGAFFQTRFALANPHAEAVPVTVTFTDTRAGRRRWRWWCRRGAADDRRGNRPPLASEAFATKFEAPRVIGVERTMSWAAGGATYGAHSETGVAAPRTSWVLAEGATIGGLQHVLPAAESDDRGGEVKVQYLLSTGERIERIHPVAPLSRTNIWVNKDGPALAAAEMSATLTSLNGVPVVVERSMYRNNGTELFAAGHNSAAVGRRRCAGSWPRARRAAPSTSSC